MEIATRVLVNDNVKLRIANKNVGMNLNSKKPEKRPLYVYYIIADVIIVLLNVFALPALSDTSVKEPDYTTFLKAVDRGKVYEATINSDYIYYTMKVDGEQFPVSDMGAPGFRSDVIHQMYHWRIKIAQIGRAHV